jgi:hypothetical protein
MTVSSSIRWGGLAAVDLWTAKPFAWRTVIGPIGLASSGKDAGQLLGAGLFHR